MNFNELKNDELKRFMKNHEAELSFVTKNLENAKKEYEIALKNFVINHITSKGGFKSKFDDALIDTLDSYGSVPLWGVIGDSGVDVLTYETMIDNEIYWLKKGQFDEEMI